LHGIFNTNIQLFLFHLLIKHKKIGWNIQCKHPIFWIISFQKIRLYQLCCWDVHDFHMCEMAKRFIAKPNDVWNDNSMFQNNFTLLSKWIKLLLLWIIHYFENLTARLKSKNPKVSSIPSLLSLGGSQCWNFTLKLCST